MEKFRKVIGNVTIAGLLFSMSPLPAFAEGSATGETLPAVEVESESVKEEAVEAVEKTEPEEAVTAVEQAESEEAVTAVEQAESKEAVTAEQVEPEEAVTVDEQAEPEEAVTADEQEETKAAATAVEQSVISSDEKAVDVELEGITISAATPVNAEDSTSSAVLHTYNEGTLVKLYDHSPDWYVTSINVEGTDQTGYIQKSAIDLVTSTPVKYEGIAIKDPTTFYASPTRNSEQVRTYHEGSFVLYYSYTSQWYKTSVRNVEGKFQTVYLNKDDIEEADRNPEKQEGIGLKAETNMYASPVKGSKVLKTYSEGVLLRYYTYTSGWYKSSVYVNGVLTTVYINKDDVEQVITNPVRQVGFAAKDPTNMYASPSRNAAVLRTFTKDTYLAFYTFTSEWYKSKVSVNGKYRTIYIHKSDVEKPTTAPVKQKGIALLNPTKLYSSPSRGSKVIRSYRAGATLLYYTYSSNWYRSSVTYNGVPHTVYIAKDDVDQVIDKSDKEEGIALKNPTKMYASPTRGAQVLRGYKPGTILKYYSYTSTWKKSYITVNGKVRTIFIHKDDVEQTNFSNTTLQGMTLKSPTHVYALPSRESKILRDYNKNMILKFYNYSKNWYKSYASVNGKLVICYIKKADIGEQRKTFYDLTLDQAVNMQKNVSPVTDKNAVWSGATTSEIEYYLDPLNFGASSDTYLQFLILSNPAGTQATELNNRVLYGKGVLAGKGSAYIKAAQTYHINEIYLISHSLLETGNGKSKLATGIKVNGVTVYNVYGVGAYDRNPDYYGAQFAYKQGWTSVEKAIIGGAKFAAEKYIHAGQDTLYEMRWNPEAMDTYGYASHQYATDIGWAVKQTTRMSQMLSTLTQFTLLYDVPVYQ